MIDVLYLALAVAFVLFGLVVAWIALRRRPMRTAALLVAVMFAAIVLDAPGSTQAGSGDEAATAPVFAPVPTPGASLATNRPAPLQSFLVDPVPLRPVSPAPGRAFAQVPRPTSPPDGVQRHSGHARQGTASWYCGPGSVCARGYPGGLYAAAGPGLRVGSWRGRIVVVQRGSQRIAVRLVDWCACPHRLIDLYADAFKRLGPLSKGVLKVEVSW